MVSLLKKELLQIGWWRQGITIENNDDALKPKNHKVIGNCGYHLCNKEKIEVDMCPYCNKYFCAEHIKPKSPKPPFGDSKHFKLQKRIYYHPCQDYYEVLIQKEKEHEKKIAQSIDKMPKGPPERIRVSPHEYPNLEHTFHIKKPYFKTRIVGDTVIFKCSFCSYTTNNLSECKYCEELFCQEHLEPKTRSDFLRTKGGHFCSQFIKQENIKPPKEQVTVNKKKILLEKT